MIGGVHVGTTIELATNSLGDLLSVVLDRVNNGSDRGVDYFGCSNYGRRL